MSFLETEAHRNLAGADIIREATKKAMATVRDIVCRERKNSIIFALEMCRDLAKASDNIEEVRAQIEVLLTASQQAGEVPQKEGT